MNRSPFPIRTILFPTDFSEASQSVIPHVVGLADAIHARVCLLNVLPWPPVWHGVSEPLFVVSDAALVELEASRKASEQSAIEALDRLRQRQFGKLECEIRTKSGAVAESIVECSEEIQASLIMMPTRGHGSPRPFLIGSVTAKVLHDAPCPVWTSPHPQELSSFRSYRSVICAVDYRLTQLELIAYAKELADYFHSRLSFVSAIPCAGPTLPAHIKSSFRLLKEETIASLRQVLEKLQINASVRVLDGSIGDVIRQEATMEDVDLVVIGRGHLAEAMGTFRTHAYEIIWNSPAPVLSV